MAQMQMNMAFGRVGADRPDRGSLNRKRFRMAILGDFSGRAARGEIETGDKLARRRAVRLDIDSVEDVIAGFKTTLVLPIGKKKAGIEVKLNGLDDLHPDELYENVEMFSALSTLKRSLKASGTAAGASASLKEWGKEFGKKVSPPKRSSRGNKVPADRKLTDFQRLIGGKAQKAEASPADLLIAQVVGPHIHALPDPDIPAMQAAIDDALSDAMRLILHHPEFQSVEAQWRMLDLIARTIESDDDFDVILYDISAEEIAADLAAVEDLTETGMHGLLAEGTPDGRGNFSALVGLYTFEETPPHAELLGRIGRLAAHLDAPFVAAMSPAFMEVRKEDRHPLVVEAWDALRAMPEAGHLMLASPRFLLRRPYGKRSDPISSFDFEEFSQTEGLSGMLWANPAVFVAILLAQSFRKNGAHMKLGSVMQIGEQPYHFVTDEHGDQVQLPCTERNVTQTKAVKVIERGYAPVLTIKGRDEIRLAAFLALSGKILLGPWSSVPPPPPSPASEPPDLDADTSGDDDSGGDEGSSDDLDLDALLGDDSGDDADSDSGGDDDLDALLAGFDDSTPEDSGDSDAEEEMDPELAALLASL
jgi:pilus assembly protein FimV